MHCGCHTGAVLEGSAAEDDEDTSVGDTEVVEAWVSDDMNDDASVSETEVIEAGSSDDRGEETSLSDTEVVEAGVSDDKDEDVEVTTSLVTSDDELPGVSVPSQLMSYQRTDELSDAINALSKVGGAVPGTRSKELGTNVKFKAMVQYHCE